MTAGNKRIFRRKTNFFEMKKHKSRSHSPIARLEDKVEEMSQEVQQKDRYGKQEGKKDKKIEGPFKEVQQNVSSIKGEYFKKLRKS